MLGVAPGRRPEEHAPLLVRGVAARTGGGPPVLSASDESPAYARALLEVYGE